MRLHVDFRARAAILAVTVSALSPLAHAVTVSSNASTPVLIGALVAGQSYRVTASGASDLLAGFSGGLGLTFTADGKPTYAFASPYAAFSPNGLDYDPSAGPSSFGVGGAGKLLGSLLGTFSAAPSGPASFFSIGLGTTFTAATAGSLYAMVNDTFYGDNATTGFTVNLAAVPEPAAYLLMMGGLGVMLLAVRRHSAQS